MAEIVAEQPIVALAIAAGAGFLLGGGVRRAGGVAILTMLTQIAMRDALSDLVADLGARA